MCFEYNKKYSVDYSIHNTGYCSRLLYWFMSDICNMLKSYTNQKNTTETNYPKNFRINSSRLRGFQFIAISSKVKDTNDKWFILFYLVRMDGIKVVIFLSNMNENYPILSILFTHFLPYLLSTIITIGRFKLTVSSHRINVFGKSMAIGLSNERKQKYCNTIITMPCSHTNGFTCCCNAVKYWLAARSVAHKKIIAFAMRGNNSCVVDYICVANRSTTMTIAFDEYNQEMDKSHMIWLKLYAWKQ